MIDLLCILCFKKNAPSHFTIQFVSLHRYNFIGRPVCNRVMKGINPKSIIQMNFSIVLFLSFKIYGFVWTQLNIRFNIAVSTYDDHMYTMNYIQASNIVSKIHGLWIWNKSIIDVTIYMTHSIVTCEMSYTQIGLFHGHTVKKIL